MRASATPGKFQRGDLRFIDQHGQELKYEIANWNTSENPV